LTLSGLLVIKRPGSGLLKALGVSHGGSGQQDSAVSLSSGIQSPFGSNGLSASFLVGQLAKSIQLNLELIDG